MAEVPVNGAGDGHRLLLADRAYEDLKRAVFENRLMPGAQLSVPELARQMQMSRSPVREAVQRLIHDGLATHAAHRGAEVARVDIDDLRELYLVRELLEGLAARLATERVDAAGMVRLEAVLHEHDALLSTDVDQTQHIVLDVRFHALIRELADNAHLSTTLEPIAGRSHFALHSMWRSTDSLHLALAEHHRIVDAMTMGDPAAAELAAREHIQRLRFRIRQSSLATGEPPSGSDPTAHAKRQA